jgi:hypothetical protein
VYQSRLAFEQGLETLKQNSSNPFINSICTAVTQMVSEGELAMLLYDQHVNRILISQSRQNFLFNFKLAINLLIGVAQRMVDPNQTIDEGRKKILLENARLNYVAWMNAEVLFKTFLKSHILQCPESQREALAARAIKHYSMAKLVALLKTSEGLDHIFAKPNSEFSGQLKSAIESIISEAMCMPELKPVEATVISSDPSPAAQAPNATGQVETSAKAMPKDIVKQNETIVGLHQMGHFATKRKQAQEATGGEHKKPKHNLSAILPYVNQAKLTGDERMHAINLIQTHAAIYDIFNAVCHSKLDPVKREPHLFDVI